eukprot:NODE_756_length_4174_cov_0.417178.p2 type:complete len:363 gc:universal NODE_756_length_4174_cov_0.417178:601-1689(+)
MLKYFNYQKMVFVSDSVCLTMAPDQFKVLKSQRRRWINSTVHNLAELLNLDSLCGFCCFSMRFMVLLDLTSTVVGPVGVLYLGYLVGLIIYGLITNTLGFFPLTSFLLLSAIYGLQMLIFIIKRDFQHVGWMVIYIFAIPVFHLILPLYSFWHFDDFTWGNTRMIQEDGKKIVVNEGEFDVNMIPHKTWNEYEVQMKELQIERGTVNAPQPGVENTKLGNSTQNSQTSLLAKPSNQMKSMNRQVSWFVDENTPQSNRMSIYKSPQPQNNSMGQMITPTGMAVKLSTPTTPTSNNNNLNKRSIYVNDLPSKEVDDDSLLKSIAIIKKNGEFTRKQILVMLQQEYMCELGKDRIYELLDQMELK